MLINMVNWLPSKEIDSVAYSAREILADARDIDAAEYDPSTRKRLHNRQRLRDARRREKDEMRTLQHQVHQLAQHLLGQSKPLPWHEVARALEIDAVASQEQNRTLKQQLCRVQNVVAMLLSWGSIEVGFPSSIALLPSGGWKESALLGFDGDARITSIKWLTERMYHNIEAALTQCSNVVGSTSSLIECTDSMVYMAARIHRVVPAPLATVPATFCRIYMALQRKEPLDASLLHESFGTSIALLDAGNGDPMELCRVFSETDRSILVSTYVAHDDMRPQFETNGSTMHGWIVNQQLNDTFTRVREFWLIGYPLPTSHEEYARELGVDVGTVAIMTDSARLDAFVAGLHRSFDAMMVGCDDNFRRRLAHAMT
ncbi:hypothetical protein, variant [Aphanomyces invadans]|uniref:Uncharacterized protein n=1 Tax=Aphanomyces invadans TaxID=157072 RepID=A0A024UBQ7_9STRA|nr:hypothetical protein H310_05492 [Aphanomyces invadans]XP_008868448.1 hypothetical protein, variant [Aphanomyces invadans]ETW03063.1 hypothetical protein H310_05492 [Aphanomyces invadans]ETW03064.1 hypothetical protein, variant [Aphanomyces invadans]|eukprot:XP_008868447.1 hypothetical protein H310_05492 [Aphanomyces invadans]